MSRRDGLHRGLLEFWDSPAFREKYLTDVTLHNVFDTLAKALGVAADLLYEADVWMTDDGSEPLPIGTGAKIKRFLDQLPKPNESGADEKAPGKTLTTGGRPSTDTDVARNRDVVTPSASLRSSDWQNIAEDLAAQLEACRERLLLHPFTARMPQVELALARFNAALEVEA